MSVPQKRTVICEVCGIQFVSAWSEQERLDEEKKNFGFVVLPEHAALLCDTCYERFMERFERSAINN